MSEMGVSRLDDQDYPAVTMGQAAELLGVQPAFLRSLDAAGVIRPQRSGGGHRRYSRRQLVLAARMRELFDDGLTLEAAARVLNLQDQLADARSRIAELENNSATYQHGKDIAATDGPPESGFPESGWARRPPR